MTTVLINAISLREGGALVLLQNLLAEMTRLRPDWEWHVITNDVANERLLGIENLIFHVYPEHEFAGWKVRLWYETALPRLAKQIQADLLFSQTNYLPSRKMPCRSLLLVQHAGHFSDVFKRLTEAQLPGLPSRLSWRQKGRWVKSSIRRADLVTVQTEALARRITEETGVSRDRLRVVPHGIGLARPQGVFAQTPVVGEPVRIGYITKYGVQKNFGVLFAAAEKLKAQGMRPVLVLTLDPEQATSQAVFALANHYGVLDVIENHGELAPPEVDALYRTLHLFVFPSLCESFGFPMVEAMAYGLPLLVAEVDSNIEVSAAAGLAFPPADGDVLAFLIKRLIENPVEYQHFSRASLERAAYFSWNEAVISMFKLMDELLGRTRE